MTTNKDPLAVDQQERLASRDTLEMAALYISLIRPGDIDPVLQLHLIRNIHHIARTI